MEQYDRIGSPVSVQYVSYKSYTLGRCIGKGATSCVYEATSTSSKSVYACKSIDTRFVTAKSLLREILLGRLLNHQHILSIHKILMPNQYSNADRLNILFPLMNSNLGMIIHNSNTYKEYKRYFKALMNQILHAVNYIHSVGVIHRDLKPGNILLDSNFCIKIADFGLSILRSEKIDYNQEVVTLFYKSPEVLTKKEYDESIDIWSVGCIFVEMLVGGQVIDPRIDILPQIIEIVDYIDDLLYNVDKELVDLIKQMLEFDPQKRISAFQALKHPFFTNDIYFSQLPLDKVDKIKLEYDIDNLSHNECISEIYKEIGKYWYN